MASEMYCPNCRQTVSARKFDWVILLLLFIAFFPAFIVYGAYCTFRKPICPICKSSLDKHASPYAAPAYGQPSYGQTQTYNQHDYRQTYENPSVRYCGSCGARVTGGSFCPHCGKKV